MSEIKITADVSKLEADIDRIIAKLKLATELRKSLGESITITEIHNHHNYDYGKTFQPYYNPYPFGTMCKSETLENTSGGSVLYVKYNI